MHILIIEDEKQLCQSIAEGLRMDGYEADTCFDGDEGLELCLVENYDLILLDLNLPGVDDTKEIYPAGCMSAMRTYQL